MTEQERQQGFQRELIALQAKYGVQIVPRLERIDRLGEVYSPVVEFQFIQNWQPPATEEARPINGRVIEPA